MQYTPIVYFLRVFATADSDDHVRPSYEAPQRWKIYGRFLSAWKLGLCIAQFGLCLAVANRPPCQPPVTHIRCLRRRDSRPTFSLPYPFVSLLGHSAHYYESASVSPFILSYYLLASLCSHGPQDRKRSTRPRWIQALVCPPSLYADSADILTNNCSTVLAGSTFPGPLITGSKVGVISKKGRRTF